MPASSTTKKALTLSIIIPAYNEENYIGDCLKAIQSQTVLPDEVIVVDNNSSDKTSSIAKKFKFVTVLSEPKQGIVYARNKGFNFAKTDLLGRIDADTQLPPEWVKNVKSLAADMRVLEAFTGPCTFRNWHGKWLLFWGHRLVYFWSSYLFLGHHTLFGSNMFIQRKLWNKLKKLTCTRNDIHEDMDLSIHARRAGADIRFSKDLKATISPRRIKRMKHYPLMWLKTQLVRHN